MTKKRTSFSLDPEIADYLSQDGINASGLVNQLVQEYVSGGGSESQMLKLRLEQVKSERKELETRLEQKREEEATIKERLDEKASQRSEAWEQAKDELNDLNPEFITPDNVHVKRNARKLDITPEELIEEYHAGI